MNGWEFLAFVLIAVVALAAGYGMGVEATWKKVYLGQQLQEEIDEEEERQQKIKDISGGGN